LGSVWGWPVPSHSRISSPFGPRRSPGGVGSTNHGGIDIAAPTGAAILAARAGRVTASGWQGGFGNTVIIDHGGGWSSLYAHNSQNAVRVGQIVRGGTLIARVGSTGNSTGPHLHFEIRVGGARQNPSNFVRFGMRTADWANGAPASGGATGDIAPPPPGGGTLGGGMPGGDFGVPIAPPRREITQVVVESTTGQTGRRKNNLRDVDSVLDVGCEILIQNRRNDILLPVTTGEITLEYARRGSPGKLTFDVVNDDVLNFHEGNPVRFRVDGENVFLGYVFTKRRKFGGVISVTCYDQIRYLKNKDTFVYENKTYSELLRLIAAGINESNLGLRLGEIADTRHKIPRRVEEAALLDMLMTASEITTKNTGRLYVLYDDFGELCLTDIEDMRVLTMIDEDTAGDFDYTSTIDRDVYNRIVLAHDNHEVGRREFHVANDETNQSRWGLLQFYDNVSDATPQVLQEKKGVLLTHYNQKARMLRIEEAFGDINVRGGSVIPVHFDLGDIVVKNFMVVEFVKHKFADGKHFMDLDVAGRRGFRV